MTQLYLSCISNLSHDTAVFQLYTIPVSGTQDLTFAMLCRTIEGSLTSELWRIEFRTISDVAPVQILHSRSHGWRTWHLEPWKKTQKLFSELRGKEHAGCRLLQFSTFQLNHLWVTTTINLMRSHVFEQLSLSNYLWVTTTVNLPPWGWYVGMFELMWQHVLDWHVSMLELMCWHPWTTFDHIDHLADCLDFLFCVLQFLSDLRSTQCALHTECLLQ